MAKIDTVDMSWGWITHFLEENLPDTLEDRNEIAYHLVREALEITLGPENAAWHTFKQPGRNGKLITWVQAIRKT